MFVRLHLIYSIPSNSPIHPNPMVIRPIQPLLHIYIIQYGRSSPQYVRPCTATVLSPGVRYLYGPVRTEQSSVRPALHCYSTQPRCTFPDSTKPRLDIIYDPVFRPIYKIPHALNFRRIAVRTSHLLQHININILLVRTSHLLQHININILLVRTSHLLQHIHINILLVRTSHLLQHIHINISSVRAYRLLL